MSHIENIVVSLENKISKILHKLDILKQDNLKLKEDLEVSRQEVLAQKKNIMVWEEKFETLKMANTILGSNDNKRETKLKINALIRDIDHCIAQLSE